MFLIAAHFFTDNWLERQIETYASGIVGAKVELDDLDLNLLQLRAGWRRLQVADPNDTRRNVIETGAAKIDLSAEPLLYGRWIIEEMQLENLRSGTKRKTDGKLPEKAGALKTEPTLLDQAVKSLRAELDQSTGIDFSRLNRKMNVDSIVQILQLSTPARLDSLQNDIRTTVNRWQSNIQSLGRLDEEAGAIVQKLQSIKTDQLKSLDELAKAAAAVSSVRVRAGSLQKLLKIQKDDFSRDWLRLENNTKSIDDWVKEDVRRAAQKTKLPDFSVQNIAKIVFGPALLPKIEAGLKYFDIAQKYGAKPAPTGKVKSPPRFKGQNIRFPDKWKMPRFWLKKMFISGESGSSPENRGFVLSGKLSNITTEPKTVGQPAEIHLKSDKQNGIGYEIAAVIDRTKDSNSDKYVIQMTNISLNNAALGGNGVLPQKVAKGNLDVHFELAVTGAVLDGKLSMNAVGVAFDFSDDGRKDRFAQITRDVLSSVNRMDLNLHFSGRPDRLTIGLNSNLDRLFAAKFKSLISDQIAGGKAELEGRIRAKLEPQKKQALSLYSQKHRELETQIGVLTKQVDEKVKWVENKKQEIEKKFEAERKKQTDGLKKKAAKGLKDLLRKKK
ncbi:MAG TPA: TIGR03545 family protein [Bacteroidetes bacterium]|nr:TIGR03545 family protein [Bacteroidota bacterium]